MITEERLRIAAIQAGTALAQGVPEACPHEFSPAFEGKMARLLRKERRGRGWAWKRAALFFLALGLAGAGWLTVDTQAREDLTGWLYGRFQGTEETAYVPEALFQPVTQERYDQYQAILDKASEGYDLDMVLRPIEDIEPNEMGSLEGFQADVYALRDITLKIRELSGEPYVSLDAGEKLSRKLFGKPFLGIRLQEAGVGDKQLPITTELYDRGFGLEWSLSPIFRVNCPVGPDPVYYIESVQNYEMVPTGLPAGYSIVADGSAWYEYSKNRDKTHVMIYQRFVLTKGLVSSVVTPWVVYHLDTTNGIMNIGPSY